MDRAGLLKIALVQMHYLPAFSSPTMSCMDEPTLLNATRDTGLFALSSIPEISQLQDELRRDYIAWMEERLKTVLDYASKSKVDLLVFPEYCIPLELLPLCFDIAEANAMHVLAASHSVTAAQAAREIYEATGLRQVIGEPGVLGPDSQVRRVVAPFFTPSQNTQCVYKHHASPYEIGMRTGDDGTRILHMDEPFEDYPLIVSLCIDALHEIPGPGSQGESELEERALVAIPSLSPTIAPFHSIQDTLLLSERPSVYVNHATHGGSRVAAAFPDRSVQYGVTAKGTKPLSAQDEAVLVVSLDPSIQFRKRASIKEHIPASIEHLSPFMYLRACPVIAQLYERLRGLPIPSVSSDGDVRELETALDGILELRNTDIADLLREKLSHLRNRLRQGIIDEESALFFMDAVLMHQGIQPPADFEHKRLQDAILALPPLLQRRDLTRHGGDILKCLETLSGRAGSIRPKLTSHARSEERRRDTEGAAESAALLGIRSERDDPFQNRGRAFSQFRHFTSEKDARVALVHGMWGIGKSSFVRESQRKILPRWDLLRLDVVEGMDSLRLLSSLAQLVNVNIAAERLLSADTNTLQQICGRIAEHFYARENSLLVLDNVELLLDEEGNIAGDTMGMLLESFATDAGFENHRNRLVLISNRHVSLPASLSRKTEIIRVREMEHHYIRRLVESRLIARSEAPERVYGRIPDDVIDRLYGHPLAATLAASAMADVGLDTIRADLSEYETIRKGLIIELVGRIGLDDIERELAEFMSVFRLPFSRRAVGKWGGRTALRTLESLVGRFIVEAQGDIVQIHPIVREAYRVAEDTERFTQYHLIAGEYYLSEEAASSGPLDIAAVTEAVYHLLTAGQTDRVKQLGYYYRDQLRPAALEAYRARANERALELYDLILSFNEEDSHALFHKVLALGRLSRWAQANEEFERLRHLTNDDPKMLSSYGGFLVGRGHVSEAEAILNVVIDTPEPPPDALCNMAILRHRQHDIKEAMRLFEEADKLAPEDPYVLTTYARFLVDIKAYPEAAKLTDRALRIDPRNRYARQLREDLQALGEM